jgi:hypothetical protein
MADIRNIDKFAYGRWAYDKHGYSEAFAGKITPSDIDAAIERNGWFLLLEHKEHEGGLGIFHLPTGQEIMLRRFAAIQRVSVAYIAGIAAEGDPLYLRILQPAKADDRWIDLRGFDQVELRKGIMFSMLQTWWNAAERNEHGPDWAAWLASIGQDQTQQSPTS